jgi:ABC-type nitrate/sulfonate/bicarbonate transport system permease component
MVGRLAARVNLLGWSVVAFVVILWQVVVATGLVEFDFVPSPIEVAGGFGQIIAAGEIVPTIGHTLGITLAATALALVVGVAFGTLTGVVEILSTFSATTIDFLRTVPVVALMPVALLVWGPTTLSEMVVATWAATWQIVVSTAAGVAAVNPRLHDVAQTLRISGTQKLRKVIVPAAMPMILVGARLATITALVVAIVAEMLINPAGLGYQLIRSMNGLQPAQMWAWAIVSGFLGFALNLLLVRVVPAGMRGGLASRSGARG